MASINVDVLIAGAGPAGLLVGYILTRLGVKTLVVGMLYFLPHQTTSSRLFTYPRWIF